MILKQLELSGFKSFAKPTVLQFPSAVTAVVGPNGSGKSNVAEALRWVLGEQSMKSLRGKKGEDLIFNGSQTAAKMGRASVSLVFDNKNKILPIDFEEVRVDRIVHRDGENEYLVNDSPVRLKDIAELLGNVGLGSSNHHIISQGEADRFLNASPKDRKEMIEEALGLKIYRIKKADAEKRLEKTAENIKQVESLRREIQHQLKFLKKETEKIEEAEKFKTELKNIYTQFIPQERSYLKKESDKISAEKNKISEDIKKEEKNKAVFGDDSPANSARKVVKEIELSLAREESELGKLRSSRNYLERELGKLEGIMEYRQSLSAKSSENNKNLPSLGEAGLPPIPRQEVLEIVEAVRELAILGAGNSDIAEARKIFEKIALSAKGFIDKISGKNNNAVIEESGEGELEEKKDEIQAMISAIEKKEKDITENINRLKLEAEENRSKIAEIEKESYQADARLRELEGYLARLSLEEDKVRLRTDEFKREEAEAGALLGREFLDFLTTTTPSRGVLDGVGYLSYQDREKFLRQAERLKIKLEDFGAVGREVLDEYAQAKQRDEGYEKELNDLKVAEKSLREVMAELADKIESDFFGGVEKINQEFGKFFVSVFGGGKAELILEKIVRRKNKEEGEKSLEEETGTINEDNQEETGVEISVSHPKKRISSLEMLSGGERSLVSISLLFAMSQVNPPPFLILDETDAALDEANSQKYALMLKSLGERTQLIVITHNRETMRQADIVYGITMSADGISRLLSIKFDDAQEYTRE